MTSEQSRAGWYFLLGVILIYILITITKPESIIPALGVFWSIFKKIIPVFILVFCLMVGVNYYVKPEKLVKYLGHDSKKTGWAIAVISGIISTGPIYLWYPLLSDIKKHGIRDGIIATFLYNRAIKPALIPLFIFYFGFKYVIILTICMVIASVANGIIVEKLIEVKI